jgi:hypothetical protein
VGIHPTIRFVAGGGGGGSFRHFVKSDRAVSANKCPYCRGGGLSKERERETLLDVLFPRREENE